jgi:hypothetical protein
MRAARQLSQAVGSQPSGIDGAQPIAARRTPGRSKMPYDTVITNGRWFDGTGAPSALRNIGVHDGRVPPSPPDHWTPRAPMSSMRRGSG